MPTLTKKLRASLARRYVPWQQTQILALADDPAQLDAMPVPRFVELFVA
jgi:hypothetical protein